MVEVFQSREFTYYESEIIPGSFVYSRMHNKSCVWEVCSYYSADGYKKGTTIKYERKEFGRAGQIELAVFNGAQRDWQDFIPPACKSNPSAKQKANIYVKV